LTDYLEEMSMRLQQKCVSMAAAALAMMLTHEVIFASNSTKFDAYAMITGVSSPPAIITVDPVHIPLTGRTYTDASNFLGDVREERQFMPCGEATPTCVANVLPAVVAFAAAYSGHLYVVSDEYTGYCTYATNHLPVPPPGTPIGHPAYCTMTTPEFYTQWYHQFTTAVRAVDPYARFAPAGLGMNQVNDHQRFLTHYQATYGVPPPVSEWRFHGGAFTPLSEVDAAAAWSVAHGAPMTWVIGMWDRPEADLSAQLYNLLVYANSDSRIGQVSYYAYDWTTTAHIYYPQHNLVDANGNLTPNGVVYKSFALGSPSIPGASIAQVGDFNADGCDDLADHDTSTGIFGIRLSLCNGSFTASGWSHGQTAVGSDYDVLVGDFTGDGWAEYADVHVPSGQVYVHASNAGIFSPIVWGYADMNDGADWELVAADVNGDGRTDIVERQLSTGLLYASLNKPTGGTPFVDTANKKYLGRSKNGPDWRVIFADFNGDGLTDFADQHTTSGTFWIHPNTGAPGFRMDNIARGEAYPAAGGSWRTVVGDFSGDGYADYMDLWTDTGAFWLHNNLQNNTFVAPGQNSGTGTVLAGPTIRILGSR
jgi:FG-GAP-like repeat